MVGFLPSNVMELSEQQAQPASQVQPDQPASQVQAARQVRLAIQVPQVPQEKQVQQVPQDQLEKRAQPVNWVQLVALGQRVQQDIRDQ